MKPPPGFPDWVEVVTAAERPELWQRVRQDGLFYDVWPEYNNHGNDTPRYFGALVPRFAQFQALFLDRRTGQIIARGRTIPFGWDGTLDGLPAGIDALGIRAVGESGPPTALSALAAEVDQEYQGSGLSRLLILTMAELARAHGLRALVAPVRPNHKDRYPITPIERYAAWRRPDGLPFDPWMRVHARIGGRILRPEPRSLHIVAPVSDWESWTGMAFPEDGQYVFPGGLAPLAAAGGEGDYWEPNVWMLHEVS
jgi:GNAT superfamily N-acetyltransferase